MRFIFIIEICSVLDEAPSPQLCKQLQGISCVPCADSHSVRFRTNLCRTSSYILSDFRQRVLGNPSTNLVRGCNYVHAWTSHAGLYARVHSVGADGQVRFIAETKRVYPGCVGGVSIGDRDPKRSIVSWSHVLSSYGILASSYAFT
jgi:hypothetical protein